jgi:group I intron endonuclease
MTNSGIYCIYNIINGKRYVGSAGDIKYRFGTHISRLNIGNHANKILQAAWYKYGERAFSFEVLEIVAQKTDLENREQYFIETLNTVAPAGYNIRKIASSNFGLRHTDEAKAKIAVASTGRKQTPAAISKRILSRGKVPHTDESKARISTGRMGIVPVWKDPAARARHISEARKGYVMPDSTKAKLSALNIGKSKFSLEVKEKARGLQAAGFNRGEIAAKIGAHRSTVGKMLDGSGRPHTDNAKARISAAARARHPFPDEIKTMIRELSAIGMSRVDVAGYVGVSRYMVSRLMNGRYLYL